MSAVLLTADSGNFEAMSLTGIGFSHPSKFVVYAEIPAGLAGLVTLEADTYYGELEGARLIEATDTIPTSLSRLSSPYVIQWKIKLPPEHWWALTLRLDDRPLAQRLIYTDIHTGEP